MNKILDTKYQYLSNFFKIAIEQNKLFHSIILHGSNNFIQYAMALELARQLNCLKDKSEDCDCQNCRWIRENKHPAIMTVSKINSKTDKSKTVISEEQINSVLDTLINSSNYHRVFIFCDAEIKVPTNKEQQKYQEFISTQYSTPLDTRDNETDSKIWVPSGINTNCFSTVGANAMLKSIEEPPSNVTFIFLTENKDDLIATVVSRSQAFFMGDEKKEEYNYSFLQNCFANYPNFNKSDVFKMVDTLLNYQTQNDLNPLYILDCIQAYLTDLLKSNTNNQTIISTIFKDIKRTEEAKQMIKSYVKENIVYEDLCFYFAKR